MRDACAASIFGHAATLEPDLAAALPPPASPTSTPADLARHAQAVLQGSFVLSKAADDPALVTESIGHLRRYVEQLLKTGEHETKKDQTKKDESKKDE